MSVDGIAIAQSRASRRILMILSNGFAPDPRVVKEARSLARNGYAVSILCWDRDANLPVFEEIDGIKVYRARTGKVKSGHWVPMMLAFPVFWLKCLLRIRKLGGFDFIHCHDLDTLAVGLVIRFTRKIPLIYDMHELYAGYFRNSLLCGAVSLLDRICYRIVDKIIVVNDRFLEVRGMDKKKCVVVMNVPEETGGDVVDAEGTGLFYAGGFSRDRDMRYVMPFLTGAGITAEFAGDGPLLSAHKQLASGSVSFPGRISAADVEEKTRRCLAVLALYDTRFWNNRLVSPNKLFDAMKFGKPAIVSKGTVMGDIVRQENCGVCVEYGNLDEFKNAVAELSVPEKRKELGFNGHQAYRAKYNWTVMERRLLGLYNDISESLQ